MDFRRIHLASAYVLWCLGTYALWLGEWEDVWPYPPAVVLAAILAFFITDTYGRFQLSRTFSNWVGVLILANMFWDLSRNAQEALTALAHFLCYLQVAKWFREKTPFDLTLIYLMNLLQLAIGAILAKQSGFGVILALYFLLGIWCAMLFFLERHARQVAPAAGTTSTSFPSLLWLSARRGAFVWGVGLPLALTFFWLLPRLSNDRDYRSESNVQQHWTGFSSVVALDQEETIFENTEIAFTILRAKDHLGVDVELPQDILWRGMVFTDYREGKWSRNGRLGHLESKRIPLAEQTKPGNWRIEIDRVMNSGSLLFGPIGIVGATTNRRGASVMYTPSEERIRLDDERTGNARVTYEIEVDPATWQENIAGVGTPQRYLEITARKPAALERVRAQAEALVADVPAADIRGRIDRVYSFLTQSGKYEYSLGAPATQPGVDPIEDFLFNRKTGHCEYFASALALLLRYADVPSRLVTGFKGTDLNRAGGYYQVRQLYAHAWVEAYLPDVEMWQTLDPTPGEARENMVARQRSWFDIVEDTQDLFIRVWGYYIVNFSIDDQRRVLTALANLVIENVGAPLVRTQEWVRELWRRKAWLVILLGLAALLALALATWMLARLTRVARRRWRAWRRRDQGPRIEAYEEWLDFLRRRGVRRDQARTALEFASDAGKLLNRSNSEWGALAVDFADSWYACRFGQKPVEEGHWEELRRRWKRLEAGPSLESEGLAGAGA